MPFMTEHSNWVKDYTPREYKRTKKIAVLCMMYDGKITPYLIKLEDEYGVIQTIDKIKLLYDERKYYQNTLTFEHHCLILIQNRQYDVLLIYYPSDSRWTMVY
jgi:hypothetical protein